MAPVSLSSSTLHVSATFDACCPNPPDTRHARRSALGRERLDDRDVDGLFTAAASKSCYGPSRPAQVAAVSSLDHSPSQRATEARQRLRSPWGVALRRHAKRHSVILPQQPSSVFRHLRLLLANPARRPPADDPLHGERSDYRGDV